MIHANTDVFGRLDRHADERGAPLANAGSPRWVATDAPARRFLKDAKCTDKLILSQSMRIARFDLDDRAYIVTVGFNVTDFEFSHLETNVHGGVLVAALAELEVPPTASEFEIKNIIEAGDRGSDPKYTGHDVADVGNLFPRIQCFELGNIDGSQTSGAFLLFCLADVRARQWMSDELLSTLQNVIELSPVDTPYATLCRSVFDHDPASLFLALYRCLEALYAWSITKDLMIDLGLVGNWIDIARKLETSLGWRPREEQSLVGLLALAEERDLRELVQICGGNDADTDLAASAAKRIYALRNALVHYRPIHQSINHDAMNWNRLCELMAIVAFYVYTKILEGGSPSKANPIPLGPVEPSYTSPAH